MLLAAGQSQVSSFKIGTQTVFMLVSKSETGQFDGNDNVWLVSIGWWGALFHLGQRLNFVSKSNRTKCLYLKRPPHTQVGT